MPITKTDGVIVVTPAKELNTPEGQNSGVARAVDFAVSDTSDLTKQLKVDLSAAATGATVTLKAGAGTTGAIELTLPTSTGAIGGAGDVVGPASATANACAIYSGTTGKLVKNSSITVADDTTVTSTGAIYAPAFLAGTVYTDNIRTNVPGDAAAVGVSTRKLFNSSETEELNWSSGVQLPQLTASRNLVLDADKKLATVAGVSGSFTTADGKTITVTSGIITAITGP